MIISTAPQKRQNRTVVLHLGNTLAEYKAWLATEEHKDELLRRVKIADGLNWCHLADGHHPECQRCLRFTHHGSYSRWLQDFNGQCQLMSIQRIRCQDCGAVFSILPSFVVRYKRWHTDAIEKLMVLLFIVEDSYRMAGVSQAFGIDAEQRDGKLPDAGGRGGALRQGHAALAGSTEAAPASRPAGSL